MKKNMKTATTLTIVATFLYCFYLLIVGHFYELPTETTLIVFSKQWTLKSPVELSVWWNLWVFPTILLVAAYCYNGRSITGEEPGSQSNSKIKTKYNVRVSIHGLTAISLVFGVWMPFVSALFQPFTMEMMGGPLSGLIIGVMTFVCAYFGFGIWVEFAMILFKEISLEDQTTGDMYTERFISYTKIGVLKTFPFLLGLTLGFMFRFMYEGIVSALSRIKTGFKAALA